MGLGAQLVYEVADLLSGDPARVPAHRCDLAVESHGRLVRDERPAERDPGSEALVLDPGAPLELTAG